MAPLRRILVTTVASVAALGMLAAPAAALNLHGGLPFTDDGQTQLVATTNADDECERGGVKIPEDLCKRFLESIQRVESAIERFGE